MLHYLIHAHDDPEHAELGLEAAHRYAQVAPDASHAQHMPSHIFLQLGDWESTVASNRRAWSASETWVEARDLPNGEKDFHALGWLHYGLLQLGDFDAADDTLEVLRRNGGRSSTVARYQARRLVEREDWTLEVSGSDDSSLFARGYAAALRGDLRTARKELSDLEDRGGEDAEISGLALEGMIVYLDGDEAAGLDMLERAANREDTTRIPSGPPTSSNPPSSSTVSCCSGAVVVVRRWTLSIDRSPGCRGGDSRCGALGLRPIAAPGEPQRAGRHVLWRKERRGQGSNRQLLVHRDRHRRRGVGQLSTQSRSRTRSNRYFARSSSIWRS